MKGSKGAGQTSSQPPAGSNSQCHPHGCQVCFLGSTFIDPEGGRCDEPTNRQAAKAQPCLGSLTSKGRPEARAHGLGHQPGRPPCPGQALMGPHTARNTHRTPNPGWAVSVTARQRCLRGQRAWKQATWEHSGMAHPEGRCYTSALPMWPGRMGHGRDACEHQAVQKQSPPPPCLWIATCPLTDN